ncbi:MAG: PIN domain-containing protein [Acidobacteria bacterium]|nr:PIN domain-containing protein [Acidobacteriota bacterium]
MGLTADLGPGAVAVDTVVLIHYIEEEPRFLALIDPLFREADEGVRLIVTSALSLLEVLVVPLRVGDRALAARYEALLTRSRGVRLVDVTRSQLRAAADLRAKTGVKTPDALQLVAAVSAGCRTFLTNDRRVPPVPGLRIRQLDSYLPGSA